MKQTRKMIATLAFVAALVSSSLGVATLKQAKATDGETEGFAMVYGASIRLADVTGLRFQVELGEKEYKEITADETVDLGMMILPEPYVAQYEAAKEADETLTYHAYFASEGKTIWDQAIPNEKIFEPTATMKEAQPNVYKDGYYYASGVMSNVKFNNYNGNFVAVAYTKTTGDQTAYDYTAKSEARSVAYVASDVYKTEDYDEDYQSTVEGFIEKSVYNLAGVKYDEATEKYTYNAEEYDGLEALKADAPIEMTVSANDVMLTGKTQTATSSLTVGGNTVDTAITYGVGDSTVATVDEENGLLIAQEINGSTAVKASAFGGMYSAETEITVSDGNIFTRAEGYRSGGVGTMSLSAERAVSQFNNGAGTTSDSGNFYNKLYEIEPGVGQGYWHEEEGAYVMYKWSKHCDYTNGSVRYQLVDSGDLKGSIALKALLEAETKYVKFDVKVDEKFMSLTIDQTSHYATNGVGTPAQMQIKMCWAADRNGTNGGEATAMAQGMFTAGEYVTVAVDISDLLTKYKAGKVSQVYFFLGGDTASEICLKNFAPISENEYYTINDPFSYIGGAKASILPTENFGSVKLSQTWDEKEGAFSVNLKLGYFDRNNGTDCARFNVDNFDNVNLPSVSNFIKRLSDSRVDGKAYLKFEVKVDEQYTTGTAGNGKKFSFWVRSDSLKASTGQVLNDVGVEASAVGLTANTWTTLYVDASKFLELYDINDLDYFQFTMYGPAGSKVSFRNLQVATAAEYEAASGANS